MDCRLCTGALTLVLAGCFSEPPSVGGSTGGQAGSDETSSAGTSAGTGTETTPSADTGSTSGPQGTSSTGGTTGSTGDFPVCDNVAAEIGQVPADVVVIVSEQSVLPDGFLDGFNQSTHVAIIAPPPVAAVLSKDVPVQCQNGCDNCEPSNIVLLPYVAASMDEAFNVFLNGDYECVFRLPPQGTSLSDPSRQLWLFTESPGMQVPNPVETRMLQLGLRLHVACPDCGPMQPSMSSDLGRLVEQTAGSIADSLGNLGTQPQQVTAQRTSCRWSEELPPPEAYEIQNEYSSREEPFFASNSTLLGWDDCEEVFRGEDGEDELLPLFREVGDGEVELCPFACRLAQLSSADETDLYRCE